MSDLIRREDVIEVLKLLMDEGDPYDEGYNLGLNTAILEVKKHIPSAEKTGHWIGTEYDGYADGHPVYDVYECSECGMEYDVTYDGEITHNYCPNCGAKMERSKE